MFNKQILLTFDLEEFDIPNEYGASLEWEEQILVGLKGMTAVQEVLAFHHLPATIFTTAAYALDNKEQIQKLAQQHEIASHTFHHSTFQNEDLLSSKQALENIVGAEVFGLRMPRMKPIPMSLVKQAGYLYDSSVNPTFIPGKYNNLHLPQRLYIEEQIHRLPCSVSPTFKIPLFWLAFKNFPYTVYKKLVIDTLTKKGYLNLYFHPWEFTDIRQYKLPFYIKKDSGQKLTDKLNRLITDLKKEGHFNTVHQYIESQTEKLMRL